MCDHSPEKVTLYREPPHIDPVTTDSTEGDKVWICNCGESWDHDPNEHDDYTLEKRDQKELLNQMR